MKLSDFELDVMQIFWDDGPGSAPVIHQHIIKQKDVAYSTVKTIIDRLEDKGALKRSWQEGRTIFYESAVTRKSMSRVMLPIFLRRMFGGDYMSLLTQTIEQKRLSIQELDYLEDIIRQKKSKRKKK